MDGDHHMAGTGSISILTALSVLILIRGWVPVAARNTNLPICIKNCRVAVCGIVKSLSHLEAYRALKQDVVSQGISLESEFTSTYNIIASTMNCTLLAKLSSPYSWSVL